MNKLVIIIVGASAMLALATLAAVLGALHWHDLEIQKVLTRELHAQRREVVRVQLTGCSAAYQSGGVAGLKSYLNNESPFDRLTSFVEVLAQDKSVALLQEPANSKKTQVKSPLKIPGTSEMLDIPSSSSSKQTWTIGRATLPDGKILFVGRMNDGMAKGNVELTHRSQVALGTA